MRLTQRDYEIIQAVYSHRLLSAHQIEALLFSKPDKPHSRRTICQKRLQLLYHHAYIDRLPMVMTLGEGRTPYLYVLDNRGADLIAERTGLDRGTLGWRPKHNQLGPNFINHMLGVNDVRVVFERLAAWEQFELVTWLDDAEFRSAEYKDKLPFWVRGARIMKKYPDGFAQIQLPDQETATYFFVEIDRGGMSNKVWQEKIHAYLDFRVSGRAQQHYGTRNFRILTVTSSQARVNNLKQATEQVNGDHYFWFTSQDNIDIWQPDTLFEQIWYIATKDGTYEL